MIFSSLSVLSLAVGDSQILLPVLLILSTLVFWAGKKILPAPRSTPPGNVLLGTVIGGVILFLCYFKYSAIQAFADRLVANLVPSVFSSQAMLNHHVFFIGVSYFSFKFIHFIIECHKGKIKELTFLTFLNYILFFPSFFSGPINRYNSFSQSIANKTPLPDNFWIGGQRIVNGLFKKIVLGDFLFPYSIVSINLNTATPLDIGLGLYAYMFYIYFNFSGYSDMAIGCGKMVGIELPENFNHPFFRRNIQQFWAHWHMSLTTWLTDYIYWPLAKKLRNIPSLRKKAVTISNISIIITFLICGIWHGDGLNFLLWGAYNGIGLALLNGYSYFIKKRSSRTVKKFIHTSPVAYGISNLITFHFVGFGFLIFACNMERLRMISKVFFT
jgi:D-alanyl-lipoteichoic acid acyltransferase DltB (MBOAT superfamily)